jgi:hypothetical protein
VSCWLLLCHISHDARPTHTTVPAHTSTRASHKQPTSPQQVLTPLAPSAPAGDMVIEYAGDLVRPAVADARERRTYNTIVGAGTYIFRLNEHGCVDATRAGNMAHLLNHSCEPNCYSRTITVADPAGGTTDHVVIFAKEDVVPGAELTYDYRFAGSERLACNCGAAKCRGFVNVPGTAEDDVLQLPASVMGRYKVGRAEVVRELMAAREEEQQ